MNQGTEPTTTAAITQRPWAPLDAGSAEAVGRRAESPSATYRELPFQGFAAAEAGNLTAYLNGIRPVEGGWTVGEIDRLLFTRHRARRVSDDAHAAS